MRVGLMAVLLMGCAAEEKDGTDAPPVDQNTDTEPQECDGTAPVLTELVVADYGALYPFEDGDAPALKVEASAKDDDGDLHLMNLVLWWDDVVDGTVDTTQAGTEGGYIAMNDEQECGTSRATYGLIFEVDGERFAYDTEYEFAAEVYDAAGLVSNQLVSSGVTPGPAR